ncbi:MAG: MarR family transcriptional regulator [Xanthomonadales bacterium]
MSERAVAELLARIGRTAYGDGFAEGLTPAQWTALRYFSRANRFSRTVSGFAEFHATTRGTASQMVKSLVKKGFLTRKRSEQDRRSVRFDLMEKSLALLERDPFESLVAAAGELSNTSRQVISRGLDCMLQVLATRHGKKVFGMCPNCKYLRTGSCCTGDETEYQCELLGEPLRETELRQLCVNFVSSR